MIKKPWIELSKTAKLIDKIPPARSDQFKTDLASVTETVISQSSYFRSAEILFDLYEKYSHGNNHVEIFKLYKNTKSVKEKMLIRFGQGRVDEYKETLKNRPPIGDNRCNCFSKEYWISKRGLSEIEATEKVFSIQSLNARKRPASSYENTKIKMKICIDYWTNKGHTKEEAEILRKPYLALIDSSLAGLIAKYGQEIGEQKFISINQKRQKTSNENMENRKSAGYVSKESIKFFIPLYKFCRKIGIPRKHIYLGVNGSREFFIRDTDIPENCGRFYDFTISKINVIIEFNGIYWHARLPEEWRNTRVDYQTSLDTDEYKETLAKSRGMSYYIIWSDEDKVQKLDEFKTIILDKWKQYEHNTKL